MVDGAPLDWRPWLAVRKPLADGSVVGLRRLRGQPSRRWPSCRAVTDEAPAERFYQRFKWDVIAPIEADRWPPAQQRLAPSGGGHRRRRTSGGGDVSTRPLLGVHLPTAPPERRETVAGECLGCRAQFAVDVRLPLPALCPDCGAGVLARADIEGESGQGRLPFVAPGGVRKTKR